MNPLALLPRKAVQTNWLGKACGGESQRGWGRAQRAGGERRAPGNMPAQPAAGGKDGERPAGPQVGQTWGSRRPGTSRTYKQRSPPRHSSCGSVQTGGPGSRKGQGRCKGAGTSQGRGTKQGQWDLRRPTARHRRPYKQRNLPRHSSCGSVQTGRLGSRRGGRAAQGERLEQVTCSARE